MSMLITYTLFAMTGAATQVVSTDLGAKTTELMAMLDKDSDGYISLKEAVGDAKLLESFASFDLDQDQKLSVEELSAHVNKLASKLTKPEVKASL